MLLQMTACLPFASYSSTYTSDLLQLILFLETFFMFDPPQSLDFRLHIHDVSLSFLWAHNTAVSRPFMETDEVFTYAN